MRCYFYTYQQRSTHFFLEMYFMCKPIPLNKMPNYLHFFLKYFCWILAMKETMDYVTEWKEIHFSHRREKFMVMAEVMLLLKVVYCIHKEIPRKGTFFWKIKYLPFSHSSVGHTINCMHFWCFFHPVPNYSYISQFISNIACIVVGKSVVRSEANQTSAKGKRLYHQTDVVEGAVVVNLPVCQFPTLITHAYKHLCVFGSMLEVIKSNILFKFIMHVFPSSLLF